MNNCTQICNQGRACTCGKPTPVLDLILATAIGMALATLLVAWWSI